VTEDELVREMWAAYAAAENKESSDAPTRG